MAKKPKREQEKDERLLHAIFGPTCQTCETMLSKDPFCKKCGAPHPYFSIQAFEVGGESLKEYLKDCQAGHLEALEGAKKERDIYEGYEYCEFCGEHVYTADNLDLKSGE